MRGAVDDDVAWSSDRSGGAGSPVRTYGLVAGFVLAVAATIAVFLTDNPQYLRLAVLAAAWAFVLAAFLAGRRRADAVAVAAREDDIRRRYEHELDREAAAHREYELELRREAEESMGAELTALRAEVGELNLLKHEVARVARLGTDLPALSGLRAELTSLAGLRDDVASLAGLRADVASLAALREDLASIAELRVEMGRLRTELTEQLNGEMLIERILLRTQSRPLEDAPRTVESSTTWDDDRPPAALTGGRPAVRLDDATSETRRPEPVRVERAPAAPATTAFRFPTAAPTSVPARSAPPASPSPPTPLEWLADRALVESDDLAPRHSRHAAGEPDDVPAAHERSGATPSSLLPPVPPRRRRNDEAFDEAFVEAVDDRTAERPASPPTSYEPVVRPAPRPQPTLRPSPTPRTAAQPVVQEPQTAGHERLEQILADTGAQPVPGRRRRRYREDDEPDDVLARVLGRNGS